MYTFLLIIVIGIIMPQLNALPINVSQNIEFKDELSSANSTTSNDDFSQHMELHLTKNKEVNIDDVNAEAKKNSSVTESKLDTKKPEDLTDNANTSTNINDEAGEARFVQNIAASGKKVQIASNAKSQQALIESEQLMSFLTKADNTLINQSADSSSIWPSPEKLSVEKKAYVEVAVAPTTTEKAIPKEALVLADVVKATGKDSAETMIVKSPVELLNDGKNKDMAPAVALAGVVKSSDKKTVSFEANVESKTGLISPSKTDVKQTNISSDKTNTAPQKPSQPLSAEPLMDNDVVSKNDENSSLTAGQKITEDTLPKEVNKTDKTDAVSDGQSLNNKVTNPSAITQVTTNNLVQADSVKSPENTVNAIEKQVNPLKEIQHEKVSSLAEPQLDKSELTQNREATQSSEVIKANKIQAKQYEKVQLAASFAEQSQQKPAVQKEDEILVADKVIASVKREPFGNSHFIDVSAKATQTPQQIIDQQSVEILNPGVATEITQSQKSNTQLHQETISLFRKDSAEAVKDKVMLMISQKLQQFDITLDPP
jgi:flagellar hook-length control protein FliK